jgi:hypothetical protein
MDTGKCGLHFETNNNTTLLILQYARVWSLRQHASATGMHI